MTTLTCLALSLLPALQSPEEVRAHKKEVAAVVRTAVEAVVNVLKDDDLPDERKQKEVIAIIEPLIDYRLVAMLSLGRTHWSRIDESQREQFVDLFFETLRVSYIEKLELFTDEIVEFEEPVPIETSGSPKYRVKTFIVSKGDRTQVAYDLTMRDGTWQAYDVEIEGVSVRKSYGSQYNDFLMEHSFDELLERMRQKVEEARAKAEREGGSNRE